MAKGKKKPSKAGQDGERMKRKAYEAEMRKLQVKLCHLQEWIKKKGLRVIIAFEGRDAAGKGGTIRALTEKLARECFGLLPCPRRPNGKRASCFSNATSSIFPPLAKSSSSTAVGTTAPASSMSWASSARKDTGAS